MELNQIITLVAGAIILLLIGIAYFTNKNFLQYSNLIKPILSSLVGVLKAVGNVFPTNATIQTITAIISAGIEATGYAENLWLQGEIDKTMRPQYAQEYIEIILERANIKVTDNITTILSGVIALTCYLMPHYSEENKEEE